MILKNEQEKANKMIENWLKEIQPDCEIEEWKYYKFEYIKIRLTIEGKMKIINISWENFEDVRDCKNWETSYGKDLKQKLKQYLKNQLNN